MTSNEQLIKPNISVRQWV